MPARALRWLRFLRPIEHAPTQIAGAGRDPSSRSSELAQLSTRRGFDGVHWAAARTAPPFS
jgi:hypothetical protein